MKIKTLGTPGFTLVEIMIVVAIVIVVIVMTTKTTIRDNLNGHRLNIYINSIKIDSVI